MQTPPKTLEEAFQKNDMDRRNRAEQNLWQIIGTLLRRWRFIGGVTFAVAVLSVVISLLIPKTYESSARLLVPEGGGGGGMLALLDDLPSAAKSLLGGSGGDFVRYIAILNSRTTMEAVVDAFDLVTVYETEDARFPKEEALKTLEDNTDFLLDKEFDFLTISVLDRDPQRAADMANFFVDELNRRNAAFSAQVAGNFRAYVEQRYTEAIASIDSLQDAIQEFQQEHGIFDLPAQTESFFQQVATLRAQSLSLKIQYETALSQYGPDNAQVRTLRESWLSSNRAYENALAGQEVLMPIPQAAVPAVAREYVELERERIIQTKVMEIVAPMRESARFEEQRKVEAVQVLDSAIPPVRKAAPKRSIIVIAATLSAFLLAIFYVLLSSWWARHHAYFARRLKTAMHEEEPDAEPTYK